MIMDKEEPIS